MKNASSASLLVACFIWLALVFGSQKLSAQHTHPTHVPDFELANSHSCGLDQDEAAPPTDATLRWEQPTFGQTTMPAPNVSVAFEPQENGAILYEKVAGWNGSQSAGAQISILNAVKNLQGANITLDKISYSYVRNGVTQTAIYDFANIVCAPNATKYWQNSRDYHQVGDVLYIDAPLPNQITIKMYFVGYATPVSTTKILVPMLQAFGLPFRAFDLASNEVWQGGSTHGGGDPSTASQVFAYDMSVQGLVNGSWSYVLPGTDGTQNSHSRVWGKPVYAIADGTVLSFNDNTPNNPAPGQEADWANFGGAGGNHFRIIHGGYTAKYSHFQLGSLNPALKVNGAVVKKGDFLGLAGNSGNSTGPHLHIHIRRYQNGAEGSFRPYHFDEGFVIEKPGFTSLDNNANWFKLENHGLPGLGGTRAFIWPRKYTKPLYNDLVYTGVWREGTDAYALWTGASAAGLATKDTEFKGNGLRMTDLSVVKEGNALKYSGVWRAGSGNSFLQTGTTWAAFNAEWSTKSGQGLRLLDIEIFKDLDGNLRYAGVYGEGNWGHYLYVGRTQAQFNSLWSSLGAQGYRLVDVEVYNSGGSTFYAGIWKTGAGGYALWHNSSWANFTAKWEEMSNSGYRLIDLDTDNTGANTIYSHAYVAGSGGYHLWQSNYNSVLSKWEHLGERGMRLIDFNVRPSSGNTFTDGDDDLANDRENEGDNGCIGSENSSLKSEFVGTLNVQISPNPTSNLLNIELPAEAQSVEIQLLDATGSLLRSQKTEGESQTKMLLGDLPTGIYFLKTTCGDAVSTQKIFKT